jgi:hypothetical protein
LWAFAAGAAAADSYDPVTRQLTIPAIAVGGITYSDMVVLIGSIVSGPAGTTPGLTGDSYDQGNDQLTVPDVFVGTNEYCNVVATVAGLVSIGGVSGADTYDGTQLSIPSVELLGGPVFTDVIITIDGIVSTGGGMPGSVRDVYNPANGELTIAAVQAGGNIYTNPIVKVGKIVAASGGGTDGTVVLVNGPSAVLNAGATRQFSASVGGIPAGAVTWSVSEAGGGVITATGLYTAPALPGTYTVRAASQKDPASFAIRSVPVVIPEGHIAGFDVGVDYHATGADFIDTAFISQYDTPAVRQAVQTQLQGMADRGATLISTRLWLSREPGTPNVNGAYALTFPMTSREQANLHAYATDVAAVVGSGGNRLRLNLCLLWLGAADYTLGSPAAGLGYTPVSAATYTARVEATTDAVLSAVNGVVRPDGVAVVDIVYIDGEAMIGAPGEIQPKANEAWFMTTHYPRFVQAVQQAGFTPSVYFNISDTQEDYLAPGYIDVTYPELNGHRSMYWLYRTLHFMRDNSLPVPARIDFSFYVPNDLPLNPGVTYAELLERGLDDADAVLPLLGVGSSYGVAETYYFPDALQRRLLGQALATEASSATRLHAVTFWSTPDGGGPGVDNAYPFAIEDYLPPP